MLDEAASGKLCLQSINLGPHLSHGPLQQPSSPDGCLSLSFSSLPLQA
jgi:hypothetical protein